MKKSIVLLCSGLFSLGVMAADELSEEDAKKITDEYKAMDADGNGMLSEDERDAFSR